jgi:hypothetical protein
MENLRTANEGGGEGASDDGGDDGAAGRSDGRALQKHGVVTVDASELAMGLRESRDL